MDKAIWIAIISAVVALSSAAFNLWGPIKLRRLSSESDAAQLARRYHEPLARAANDLQSRLYNSLVRGFAGRSQLTRIAAEPSWVHLAPALW